MGRGTCAILAPAPDRPILVMKWGNAHGAKGAGHSRRDRWVNRKLEEPTVSTEDGSLQWVARAGYVERPKSGSVRGSGCNSPDLLGLCQEGAKAPCCTRDE